MAKRKWLLGASGGLLLAGGLAISPAAEAALELDLRLVGVPAGVTLNGPKSATIGTLGAGDFVFELYARITDAPSTGNAPALWAVGGSFTSLDAGPGAITGTITPAGAVGYFGFRNFPTDPATPLPGIQGATPLDADFAAPGSHPGLSADINGDGIIDLGGSSATNTDISQFAYMREAAPDTSTGTVIDANTKEWKVGRVVISNPGLGAGSTTTINFLPRTTADGSSYVADTAWWYEPSAIGTPTGGALGFRDGLTGTISFTAPIVITSGVVTEVQWNGSVDNSYATAGNWTGPVPNGVSAVARFHSLDAGDRVVNLSGPVTLGVVSFDNAAGYKVSGGSLTLNNGASAAEINVVNGSHSLTSPITAPGNVNLTFAPTAGTLTLGQVTVGGTLSVPDGAEVVIERGSGTSKVGGVSLGAGATIDLTDNDVVVANTPAAAVRAAIKAGALTTSLTTADAPATVAGKVAALGYAQGDDPKVAGLGGNFGGQTFGASDTIVKYTLAGDADLDGDVDLLDVLVWGPNFTGELGGGPTATKTWSQGDWDYDGDVDLLDVLKWGPNFTGELGGGGLSIDVPAPLHPEAAAWYASVGIQVNVVPEPATMGLLGVAAIGLLARRGGRRRI